MLRRDIRLRREYLYRKSLEADERKQYEEKRLLRQALQSGGQIPSEIRYNTFDLHNELKHDDNLHTQYHTSIDDEYQNAGKMDPKICITTSRSPSSRLVNFSKELTLCFPNSLRINRGGTKIEELMTIVKSNNFTDVIIVHEHRGEPDGLIVCHLPYGPTAYFGLRNVVLRHDINHSTQDDNASSSSSSSKVLGTVSEAYPHLVFDHFDTKLGQRLKNILRFLFPVPKHDTRRVMSFVNRNDTISYRHHVYKKLVGKDNYELTEVGPRFEMQLYQLRLGTIEQSEAENEWVLRPYMNTSRKRKHI